MATFKAVFLQAVANRRDMPVEAVLGNKNCGNKSSDQAAERQLLRYGLNNRAG